MLQLSRSRLSVPVSLALLALAAAAPAAQALPPVVTLSAPVGHVVANPPAFAGTAGTLPWESREISVEVFKGESVADADRVQSTSAIVGETGAFSGTFADALADGTYTARARQTNSEQEKGYSAPSVFTIGAVEPEPTPTPTPTPTPVPQAAATATPTPAAETIVTPPAPYVCKSRRNFNKHVRRPDGTRVRVAASVEGRVLKSTLRRRDILVHVDLRGLPKDIYDLRVRITRTRPDGRRVTTESVTEVSYRTCALRGPG